MSGFEAAIRNALVRSSSGTPQSRQRVYAAARASLERNLSRVNADAATATTQRQRLETTIDAIEGEWSGRPVQTADIVREPVQEPIPQAPEPPVAPTTPPVARSRDVDAATATPANDVGADQRVAPAVESAPPVVAKALTADAKAPSGGTEPTASPAPRIDETEPPAFQRSATPRPSNEARLMEPPPDEVATPRRSRDPFFAGEGQQSVEAAPQPRMPTASGEGVVPEAPPIAPEPKVAAAAPASRPPTQHERLEPNLLPEQASTTPAVDLPRVDADERGRRKPAKRDRSAQRRDRRAAKDEAKRERREAKRRRRPFRLAALLIVLLAIGAAYVWINEAGLLEGSGDRPAPITVAGDRQTSPSASSSEEDWQDVNIFAEQAIAGDATVTELDGEPLLRVEGPVTLALDGDEIAGLGDRLRLAITLRGVGSGGEVAFSCENGLACGRTRLIAPRQFEERVLELELNDATAAALRIEPNIVGSSGPIEISSVRALGI